MTFTWTRDTLCAHQDCDNHADPRWMAYCRHGKVHYICDGRRVAEGAEAPVEHPWTPYVNPCDCEDEDGLEGDESEVERGGPVRS